MRVAVLCAIGILLVSWLQLLSAAPGEGGTNADLTLSHVTTEVLVKFKVGVSEATKAAALQKGKGARKQRLSKTTADELMVVNLNGNSVANAIKQIGGDDNVEYVEPNYIYSHQQANDPYYVNNNLWGMYGPSTTPRNAFGSNAAAAWAAGDVGNEAVHIGIIDEGIQVTHPDLAANIWVNSGDAADGVDNDANGYTDDLNGWDFVRNDKTVYDEGQDSHGTHVAGTIGGVANNALGVAGVAQKVKMISGKFLGPNGGTTDAAIRAIEYMTDLKVKKGLKVVATSNSWGGGGYSGALYNAIQRAAQNGILFVAAAGNSRINVDKRLQYPCAYNLPNVICVAAIDSAGNLARFSNFGTTRVHLAAPGVSIWSTWPTNSYFSISGTSMATPHVSGAVALYAAKYPSATAAQIRSALLSSVTKYAAMTNAVSSGGRLDVARFLSTAPASSG